MQSKNYDIETAGRFGDHWQAFDQSGLAQDEKQELFRLYFRLFPWSVFGPEVVGLDVGCGTGRWAQCVAPLVGRLHCLDVSEGALAVARKNLKDFSNCAFHAASVAEMPVEDNSMDFVYCLGILHYVPDPLAALRCCVSKLKPGAPLLLYVYYSFENRPTWFRALAYSVGRVRSLICHCPYVIRWSFASGVAALLYYPLARASRLAEKLGFNVDVVPLSAYRERSYYTMRTDAFERFDQRWEHRFSRRQLAETMRSAGLGGIQISDESPYWTAIGYKAI